jgi:hypothetical protein
VRVPEGDVGRPADGDVEVSVDAAAGRLADGDEGRPVDGIAGPSAADGDVECPAAAAGAGMTNRCPGRRLAAAPERRFAVIKAGTLTWYRRAITLSDSPGFTTWTVGARAGCPAAASAATSRASHPATVTARPPRAHNGAFNGSPVELGVPHVERGEAAREDHPRHTHFVDLRQGWAFPQISHQLVDSPSRSLDADADTAIPEIHHEPVQPEERGLPMGEVAKPDALYSAFYDDVRGHHDGTSR